MGRRGNAPRAAAVAAAYAAVHRSLQKSHTPGGKRSTSISRKRQRSQSPSPSAAANSGIMVVPIVLSPTPRRRSTSRKRLPKRERSIVSGPARAAGIGGAIIGTKILTLRNVDGDIEKAGSAKKQKTVSEKIMPMKNHFKVKKKLPPKKVESSSSDEYSSESEDEGSSSGAAKPFLKVAKKESSGDDDSSEESSSSDEENDQPVSMGNSKKNGSTSPASSTHQATTRSRTLFVANLSPSVENELVKRFFEEAGEVIDIRFATSDDGSFKGSTHVEFATTEAAEKAYKLNGRDLAGRPVRLDFACERGAITPCSKRDSSSFKKPGQSSSYAAVIGGFESSLEDEIRNSLQQHLSSCGEITRVLIAKDYDTCSSKEIVDMEFSDKSSLPKALELTGYDLRGFSSLVDEPKPSPDNRDGPDSDRDRNHSGAPPRQSAGSPSAAPNCMDYGLILVLFETPSGFAIFNLFEREFREPDALENFWANFGEHFRCEETLWLEEFRTFKDKSTAITHGTGVSKELTDMILRYHHPRQKLAVGKPEYKTIIEKSLGIDCLFDETVMEVMWGLKNIMHSLVPQEEVKLTKEDRLPMSQGLKMLLNRHGFDVKPEMVNEKIVVLACVLFDCEYLDKRNYALLGVAVDCLKDISGINAEGWDLMKLATALMIMRNPAETDIAHKEMFTGDELSKLETDAHKYDTVISKPCCLDMYKEILECREFRTRALKRLEFRVKEAEEAWKAEQSVRKAKEHN